MPVAPPKKPFADFKWRWAALTPTEGLNEPPIFLGVLRVLANNQGRRPSSPLVSKELLAVEKEVSGRVSTTVHLSRSSTRNLLRNSGQYWKALGLTDPTARGKIVLSDFGKKVADGLITQDEFAATVIRSLELPNVAVEGNIRAWKSAGIRLKPLELILEILRDLENTAGPNYAYITTDELVDIVIPLSGELAPVQDHAQAITEYRSGTISLAGWPKCAPRSNDRRMAREFLLFLSFYGFIEKTEPDTFHLSSRMSQPIKEILRVPLTSIDPVGVSGDLRSNGSVVGVLRERVLREVLNRPGQAGFRRDVLGAFKAECLFTGERVPEILEASHIIPVKYNGPDVVSNGLCLRVDVHNLFDLGLIRLEADGTVHRSPVLGSSSYSRIPKKVKIPSFTDSKAILWRWKFL